MFHLPISRFPTHPQPTGNGATVLYGNHGLSDGCADGFPVFIYPRWVLPRWDLVRPRWTFLPRWDLVRPRWTLFFIIVLVRGNRQPNGIKPVNPVQSAKALRFASGHVPRPYQWYATLADRIKWALPVAATTTLFYHRHLRQLRQ